MKKILFLFLYLAFIININAQNIADNERIITYDIDNFWVAFDKITSTKDTTKQLEYINKLYIEKGSIGLKNIMLARRYTAKSYIDIINNYPLFWKSIRENTLKAKLYAGELEIGIEKLKAIYPELKPAKIYFTIGAFRTPGTILNGTVLIGSEMSLGDNTTISTEFPKNLNYFATYLKENPNKEVVFLNIHEYVHTQQKAEWGYDLLSQALFEGIPEFVAVKALAKNSPAPAISYGKINDKKIKKVFEKEMFSNWYYNWIWNNLENEFKTRDLGYYVGYAIAERYYEQAKDKKAAIKTLIELDYTKPAQIEKFVDETKYFSKSIKKLKEDFEKNRPYVVGIKEFKNGQQNVNPNISEITIQFSQKMDKGYRSMDFGALGKDFFPKVISAKFTDDCKSVVYQVKFESNKQYQFVVMDGYRNEKAIQLKKYEINIKTK